jgi:hypothetical protein
MVTYFNKKDLIEFGRYLLSDEKTKRFTDDWSESDNIPIEEWLQEVYHADVENFLEGKRREQSEN